MAERKFEFSSTPAWLTHSNIVPMHIQMHKLIRCFYLNLKSGFDSEADASAPRVLQALAL